MDSFGGEEGHSSVGPGGALCGATAAAAAVAVAVGMGELGPAGPGARAGWWWSPGPPCQKGTRWKPPLPPLSSSRQR
eukprot:262330-Pelagomonas_calceolata.AAC.1